MASVDSMAALEIHPAAEIFPLIEGGSLVDLANDIKANGLREPITLHPDGRILDGRNRYRACGLVGVSPHFKTWDGHGSPVAYVVSLNLHRRHLDESQRAMVADAIANLSDGQRPDLVGASIEAPTTQTQAAEMLNVSRASVQRAHEVREHGTPELVKAVQQGRISVSAATEVTEFEPGVQREVVERVEAGEKPTEVIRDVKPHVSNNSGNNEWYTPPQFIEAAKDAMGSITLDPASSPIANRTVCAEAFYTVDDDGLKKAWRGNIWLNPPYAQPLIAQFTEAVCEKFKAKEIKRACVLVNNATETAWFQRMLESAMAVCFLKGRIKYLDATGEPANTPLQGQAVVYLGDNPVRFARAYADLGTVLYREA